MVAVLVKQYCLKKNARLDYMIQHSLKRLIFLKKMKMAITYFKCINIKRQQILFAKNLFHFHFLAINLIV